MPDAESDYGPSDGPRYVCGECPYRGDAYALPNGALNDAACPECHGPLRLEIEQR